MEIPVHRGDMGLIIQTLHIHMSVDRRGSHFPLNTLDIDRAVDEFDFIKTSYTWDSDRVVDTCGTVTPGPIIRPVPVVVRITRFDVD